MYMHLGVRNRQCDAYGHDKASGKVLWNNPYIHQIKAIQLG